MDCSFSTLLGGPYRGGNLLFHDQELLSAVGNRVHQVDLACSLSNTLPFQNAKPIRVLALSPDGSLLLSVDEDGRALLSHRSRRVVLHHFTFKDTVRVAKFSPDGRLLAVGVGRLLQVWHTPSLARSMTPMHLLRTYGHAHDAITCVDWAPDGTWIVAGGRDLVARVYSLHPVEDYQPPTLAGHRAPVVGTFWAGKAAEQGATLAGQPAPALFTLARDGALLSWAYHTEEEVDARGEGGAELDDTAMDDAMDTAVNGRDETINDAVNTAVPLAQTRAYAGGRWQLLGKQFLWQQGAQVGACDYHRPTAKLLVAYTNGLFELYQVHIGDVHVPPGISDPPQQLPEVQHLQSLSISRDAITAAAFSATGEWLALGAATAGQLLVWEWRSETYVLKQQGHFHDVAALAYSPDGGFMVTGADDAKVKVWNLQSGFCFATFTDHAAPVTAVQFLGSGHAVLSASLDGSVRAFDLVRYRNFRTLTAPSAAQFISLAVDAAGEVVAAGAQEPFSIFVWSLKTGRLLDVLEGHEGPVCGLAFNPTLPMLLSCSWDRTLRTWDVFGGKGGMERLDHSHDVLALAVAPTGRMVATSTLDGQIYLWNAVEGELLGTIEGRRDIGGGRGTDDKRSLANRDAGKYFSSLQFSADGALLLAGGASKYVCLYDVAERVMLRRFQTSVNRALEGVLDEVNTKAITDAGPLGLIRDDPDDPDDLVLSNNAGSAAGASGLPGTGSIGRPQLRTRAVLLSPTANGFAAATTEGVLVFAPRDAVLFDPTDLAEEVTPAAVHAALAGGAHLRALLLALRLGGGEEVQAAVMKTPPQQVGAVVGGVPAAHLVQLLTWLASALETTPHVEFLLRWVQQLLMQHGSALQSGAVGRLGSARVAPALRAVHAAATRIHKSVGATAQANINTLEFLSVPREEATD